MLSGTPKDQDVGLNQFTVRVTDSTDLQDKATLELEVLNLYDGEKGMIDFAVFSRYWLEVDCGLCGGADLNADYDVNMLDLSILADRWLLWIELE